MSPCLSRPTRPRPTPEVPNERAPRWLPSAPLPLLGERPTPELVARLDQRRAYALVLAESPQVPVQMEVGQRFMLVAIGDHQAVDVSSSSPGIVERLPDSETGPAVPGATLVPLQLRFAENTVVSLTAASGLRLAVTIDIFPLCIPRDFPRYPGALILGDSSFAPCHATWLMRDDPGPILQTYVQLLDQGDWRVIGTRGSEIEFARRSRPAVRGTVHVMGGDKGARIQVQLHD